MANVLIIDDDKVLCKILSNFVKRMHHSVFCTLTLADGLNMAREKDYDVVFLDVMMPDGSGLEILPEIRNSKGQPEVIIMTATGTTDGAEMAIKNGAWDYIQKPVTEENILLSLGRVFQYRESLQKIQKPILSLKRAGIIGNSHLMRNAMDSLAQAAASDANVLITGETGTGKEMFARAIHLNSRHTTHSFVVVDCAALPETLVESTLFGHVKGSFTGAERTREGLVKQADGGTLFLDEIGELSLPLQKAFLRVLQERRFRPVGSEKEIESNFRLVAATNKDLDKMVEQGLFRQDLLYRLRATAIELPPLRHRPEDIKELVLHYTGRICERYGMEIKGFSSDFLEALYAYDWPGNVRELVNTMESSIAEAQLEAVLFSKHLPTHIRIQVARAAVKEKRDAAIRPKILKKEETPAAQEPLTVDLPVRYKDFRKNVLAAAEKKYLNDLISYTKGSIKEACKLSGLGRTRLYTLMKEHDISRFGWS